MTMRSESLKQRTQRRLTRELAKAREVLESTRSEDYSTTSVYSRVVSLRLHKVRRLKKQLAELDGLSDDLRTMADGSPRTW